MDHWLSKTSIIVCRVNTIRVLDSNNSYKEPKYWPQHKRRNWLRFLFPLIMIVSGIIAFVIAVLIGSWIGSTFISMELGILVGLMEFWLYMIRYDMPKWFYDDRIRMKSAEIESYKYPDGEV